jgi:hypothetical protein
MQKRATGDYPCDEISFRLHEAAYRNQEASESAIRKLEETDEMLRQRIEALPNWVAGEVDKRLEKVVHDAAEQITPKVTAGLKAVIDSANRARVQYENAAKFAPKSVVWTALGCFATGCIGMIIGVYIAARLILPAPDVLQREREAEQNVEKLAPRGGNSVLAMCKTGQGEERQCIRTDERGQQTPFAAGGETYRIIYGY